MSPDSVTVTVPATTANLGPGFDCLGAALTLYNEFKFTRLSSTEIESEISVTGTEAKRVSTDKTNLLYRSFVKFYQHIEQITPPVAIEIGLGVPLARGLGSSATAIVGGLVAANELAGTPLSSLELMALAIAIEGHPDNVVPALLGHCQLSVGQADQWQACPVPWHPEVIPVVAIPDFELSTTAARSVLPANVSRADAIFNVAHMGLLLRGLEAGRGDWLHLAMADKLHQPYRQELIHGYKAVEAAAIGAGAYGVVISGAGPTLLALAAGDHAQAIAEAIAQAWKTEGVTAEARSLSLDTQGTKVNASQIE